MCSEGDTKAGNKSRMERLQCDNISSLEHFFSQSEKKYLTVQCSCSMIAIRGLLEICIMKTG